MLGTARAPITARDTALVVAVEFLGALAFVFAATRSWWWVAVTAAGAVIAVPLYVPFVSRMASEAAKSTQYICPSCEGQFTFAELVSRWE